MKYPIFKHNLPLVSSILKGVIIGVVLSGILIPQTIYADSKTIDTTPLVQNGHLTVCKINKSAYEVVKTVKVMVTAYSSTPDQTDDTPFITASGKRVADGIIANNMLPFGTKVRIPDLYGDKVFTVEDRMNARKGKYHVDIWMEQHQEAKDFGAKITTIEVLEN